MATTNVSLFRSSKTAENGVIYDINMVLDFIQQGEYADKIKKIRHEKDEIKQKELKRLVPSFIPRGVFPYKKNDAYDRKDCSGLIGMDFDKFETTEAAAEFRDSVISDPYCFAAFLSCRGKGVCALFLTVAPKDNEDNQLIYRALADYLADLHNYTSADPSCGDVSRGRIMSWDAQLKRKQISQVKVWEKRAAPIPKKAAKDISKFDGVAVRSADLDYICAQLKERNFALCDVYGDFFMTGMAIARKFGEAGREYFAQIASQCKPSRQRNADRQYDACIGHADRRDDGFSWGSFVKLCRDNGIEVQTSETKMIISSAISHKKSGAKAEDCAKTLEKFEGIQIKDSEKLIASIYSSQFVENPDEGTPPLKLVERWIKSRAFKYNEFSDEYEFEGKPISTEKAMNTIYFSMLNEVFGMENKVNDGLFIKLLNSDCVPSYNPVKEYFESLGSLSGRGREIKKLAKSLNCTTGIDMDVKGVNYVEHFLRKWLIQLIAVTFDGPTDIMLILAGEKNGTGKSYFFNNILPKKLQKYTGSFRLENTNNLKDNQLLLCQKLLVFVDDATKKDLSNSGQLKEMVTASSFNLRRPYGRANEQVKKRAIIAASTNKIDFIENSAENRRMVTFHIQERFFEDFCEVNIDSVWTEAYESYKNMSSSDRKAPWLCSTDDIFWIQKVSLPFEEREFVDEELVRIFEPDESGHVLQLAEIMTFIAQFSSIKSLQNITAVALGMRLSKVGNKFPCFKKIGQKGYPIKLKPSVFS